MALKVQYNVERNTNVPGILRWKNHGYIIRCNRWKVYNLRFNVQEFSFIAFNFYLFNDIQRYPTNMLECESPPRTNSMKKNPEKQKSGNHLHIHETPFHVDVL